MVSIAYKYEDKMHSIKCQPVTVTNKCLIIKTLKSHQLLRTISTEMDATEITTLLTKQINAFEALQLR